ncbi:MAG TPA: hypothetical protein VEC02_02820 [Nitrososphaerales archaeon]|nr:hypothetical protein [Nitrososphaerales archaeon]
MTAIFTRSGAKGYLHKVLSVVVLLTLLVPVPAQALSQNPSAPLSTAESSGVLPHSVFEQGLLNLTRAELVTLVGGENNMNVSGFSRVIMNDFWPTQTRVVGLDIGWTYYANTTTPMPHEKWVDDFLTAADEDNISVAFYLPDWGANVTGQSWWSEVEAKYPFLQTSTADGLPVNQSTATSLVLNSPIVVQQLERDLSQLLRYYGKHDSWVGLISDSLAGAPNADELLSNTGFDRYSISQFANSTFYLRTVNGSGSYPDGTNSSLWSAFHQPVSSPELVTGYWQSPDSLPLYNGSQNELAIRISVPSTTFNPKVRLYLGKTGSPTSPIQLALVPSSNVTGYPLAKPLVNVTLDPSQVSQRANWTEPIQFNASLTADTPYWIVANSPAGNETNSYQVWYRDFHTDDSAVATEGSKGIWYPMGSAIAWITNSAGEDLKIYPYQNVGIARNDGSTVVQQFETEQAIDVRTVYIFVADKLYSTVNSTLQIIDDQDSSVLASVTFSQAAFKGTYWWVPISLPTAVYLQADHPYSLKLLPVAPGNGWQWHYLITDPSRAGFQGRARVQLFRLESYSILSLNLMHIGPPGRTGPENGFPGATNTTWYAQSFTISVTAPLLLVQANVEKYCHPGSVTGTLAPCPAGQHPGNLVIQLRNNNAAEDSPGSTVLANKTIPEAGIPWGRVWVNATGWNLNLTAGMTYWVVLSTVNGTTGGYYPWKEESAYQHLILRSSDGGATWGRPREPADMLIDLRTGAQSFTVEPEYEITVNVGSTSWVSQSIEVGRPTNVSTILIFVSREDQDNEGTITVDVRADDGYGHPSPMVLATGSLTPNEDVVTWKGIWAVNLDYPITLQAGVKYWLVFRSVDTKVGHRYHPEMGVQAFAFYNDSASYGGSALGAYETSDSGQTWSLIGGRHTDLIFGLAYSPLSSSKPSMKQLVAEIQSRQLLNINGGRFSSAWQSFLAVSTSEIEAGLVSWLSQQGFTRLASGNTTSTIPPRTWIAFDTNSPSMFEDSAPGPSEFDLYPAISINPGTQSVVPSGGPPNSIPVIVLASQGGLENATALDFLTAVSYLNRSIVFVNADPVGFFGRLNSLSDAFNLLSRMRSQGLSWPDFGSSSSSGLAVGPWMIQNPPGAVENSSVLASLQNRSLASVDIGSMNLTWKGTGAHYHPSSGTSQVAYLLNTWLDLDSDYSNVPASSQTVYPNQALLKFAAPRGEEIWALINSTRPVQVVAVNDVPLPEATTYSSLVADSYASRGWSQQPSGILLVRFPSSGQDTVRVVIAPPPQPNQLVVGLTIAAPFIVLASAVVADVTVWALFLRKKGSTRAGHQVRDEA